MRFHTLLILLTFLGLISVSLKDYSFSVKNLDAKVKSSRQIYVAKRFIAESFRNTCSQKGFKDLEEWQVCCRNIYNLEYIGWCEAREFMIDEAFDSGPLMYGKWEGKQGMEACSGEVYCRIKRSDF